MEVKDTLKLCECGCRLPAPIATFSNKYRGYVKGQPMRFVHGHNGRSGPPRVEDRGYKTPCWIWQGPIGLRGYGKMQIDGAYRQTHRHFYELEHGPIPPGYYLDHLCRQILCCNPEHLDPVTPTESARRRPGYVKLNKEKADEIRRLYETGQYSQSDLGRRYGVSQGVVWHVVRYKTWL